MNEEQARKILADAGIDPDATQIAVTGPDRSMVRAAINVLRDSSPANPPDRAMRADPEPPKPKPKRSRKKAED